MPVFRFLGTPVLVSIFVVLALTGAAYAECGKASWYGPKFHGRVGAFGEVFDQNAMTAAHKTLPFGARVKVTREFPSKTKDGKKFVVVRINDRGPYKPSRIIDLSRRAAIELGLIEKGTGRVCISRVKG